MCIVCVIHLSDAFGPWMKFLGSLCALPKLDVFFMNAAFGACHASVQTLTRWKSGEASNLQIY